MGIEPVERDQAPPIVQRIYDAIEKRTGSVSPFFRMLGNNPEPLRASNQLYGVVWAEGALQAKLKEPGGARREDLFDARERAVRRFATLLTSHPAVSSSATWTSLAHLSAEEPFELVVAIATTDWTNRFNDGLGTPLG